MKKLIYITAAASAIAAGAAFAETSDARNALFDTIDADNNDLITRSEFRSYAKAKHDADQAKADDMFDEITGEDADEITLVMFESTPVVTAWLVTPAEETAKKKMAAQDKKKNAAAAQDNKNNDKSVLNKNFAAIDDNGNGVVTRSEFASFIAAADNVTKNEARNLFDVAAGKDKQLTLAEFVDSDPKMRDIAKNIVKTDAGAPATATLASVTPAKAQHRDMSADYEGVFKKIDENGDGEIRRSEYLEFVRLRAETQFGEMAGPDHSLTMSEFENAEHDFLKHAGVDRN